MDANNLYTEIKPCAALQAYVDCYWILKSDTQITDAGAKDKILPYGFPEIGFIYGDGFNYSSDDSAENAVPACFIAGQFCQPYYLHTQGEGGIVAVKFKPTGLFELFKVPMKEFTNKIADFINIVGEEAKTWAEQIAEAPTNYQRIKLIENFLLQKLHNRETCLGRIQHIVSLIMEKLGNVTVKELSYILNISDRQLERRFLEEVGVSPKLFARVIRLNYALKLLRTNPDFNWQDVIYLCGYYDQAHFIRDFKGLAGESPNSFMARNSAVSVAFQGAYFR